LDRIAEEHVWLGRRLTVTWHGLDVVPPRNRVTQASGVCFTDDSLVVLVTADGETWGLPGGHPEEGETIEAAFIREVKEEAGATVIGLVYLGASEVNDPGNPEGVTTNYQARFWARVQLDEFRPEYETTGRKLVTPSDIVSSLRWYPSGILEAIIDAAVDCERRYTMNKRRS